MYIRQSVLLCFCYKDFYSKENKLTELSCVRFSRGRVGAWASCPPRPGMEGGGGKLPTQARVSSLPEEMGAGQAAQAMISYSPPLPIYRKTGNGQYHECSIGKAIK